jgi:hypothetical protein
MAFKTYLLGKHTSKAQRAISEARRASAKGDHTVHTRAQFLRQYVKQLSTERISEEELCSALLELHVVEHGANRSDTKRLIDSATRDVFTNAACKDAFGRVDLMEAVAMVHTVAEHWRAVQQRKDSLGNMRYSIFLALTITMLSTLFFWVNDQVG